MQNEYLDTVKRAKDARAVIKMKFATFASAIPDDFKIFAYEGVNDKAVYFNWIQKIRQNVKYEAYLCGNKDHTLKLFDSMCVDRTGLGDRLYYFVDHDFDGLQGRDPDKKIFVTDKYSIENYFVCRETINDILTLDLHCNGYPDARSKIGDSFEIIFEKFLSVTFEINLRVFSAKKLRIAITENLPKRISEIAVVSLEDVSVADHGVQDKVRLEREPTENEVELIIEQFRSLNPKDAYRGKFALLFLLKWLELLRQDRLSEAPIFFKNIPSTEFAIKGNFSIDTLSPKVPAPLKLRTFIEAI